MEVGREDRFEIDERVVHLIGSAVLAGAYSETIRRVPETAAGFDRLREKHSRRVTALAREIAQGAGRFGPALALGAHARKAP
jgi:hypothetical protein